MSHLSSPQADNSQLSCDIHTGTLFAPPTKYKNVYNSIETLQMLPTLQNTVLSREQNSMKQWKFLSFFFVYKNILMSISEWQKEMGERTYFTVQIIMQKFKNI